ncbi:MAG: hypothetical protein ACRC1H_10575, partial [Caldilineaceae bacterium]
MIDVNPAAIVPQPAPLVTCRLGASAATDRSGSPPPASSLYNRDMSRSVYPEPTAISDDRNSRYV